MTTLLSFLFVLGVLVFVHELGHFLVARWHGVRVITFSLGFGPKIAKFRRGDTEYCISVVPLGGYVKLAGETVDEARTGSPDEFLSKSKWVRFQVYIAGPIMNILLAIIVLAGVLSRGADVPLFENSAPIIGSVAPNSPAAGSGLRAGDRVTRVDGKDVPSWDALNMAVLPRAGRELVIEVMREGTRTDVRVTPTAFGKYELGDLGIKPLLRPQIVAVNQHTAADRAGLQHGDVLLAINGERDLSQEEIIKRISSSPGKPLVVTVERGGQPSEVTVVPEGPDGAARIGVAISPYETRRIDPTLPQAFKLSLKQNWDSTVLIGKTLRGLFTRDTPVRQLMGPVAIAEMSGNAAQIGWIAIFNLMAMISLNLGLLNLMPVPVLDGGHIAILAIEGLARRDLSLRVKERMLMAGAAMIVLLMVTVIVNDISRLLR
ncbi:MAG: RIP metalloprotease RseP [Vicinamibacterales bacterium]